MPLAFAAIGLGVLYLVSGFKGISLAGAFRGEANNASSLNPAGGTGQTIAFFGGDSGGGSAANPGASASTTNPADSPGGTTLFDGKPVANWIVPYLKWARNDAPHKWHGKVTSGYRTAAEQQQAASNYGLWHYPNGVQASNHRKTQYPGGAVDVSDAAGLNRALRDYPGGSKLIWAGPIIGDMVHFSGNGH